MNDLRSVLPILIGIAVFGAVASLWCIAVIVWYNLRSARQRRFQKRLGLESENPEEVQGTRMLRLWREGKAMTMFVPKEQRKPGRLRQIVDVMGWDFHPGVLVAGLAASGLIGFVVAALLLGDAFLAVGVGLAMVMGPWMYLSGLVTKRESRFDEQLSSALAIAARSLRAGHPLSAAFQLIAEETEPPVSEMFAELLQQQSLGLSLQEAVLETSKRHTSSEVTVFAAAVVIQSRSGGNLADTMERLAKVMRDRLRMVRRAKSLTAQVQLSKRVLVAVPFATALLIYVLSPQYMRLLFETDLGRVMIGVAALLLIVGVWVMNKMATLEY